MVAETGYIWSTLNFDGLGNIIKDPDPQYLPVIPEKQLEYMTDYTRAVMRAGGIGVIFWEPAWVSTPCRTPWGMGSSHDHVVFFDPVNTNFMENGGGRWGESRYYQDPDDLKLSFKVEMTGQDVSKGVYIAGSWPADTGKIIPMADEGNGIYSYYTYVPEGDTGYFFFLNDTLWSAREQVPAECASYADTARSYAIQSTNKTYSYKWSSCEPAVPPDQPDVTFNVSMKGSGMDLSGGVYLVGDVTEWEFIQMAGLGDSLYSVTLEDINEGSPVAYYFITTNSWDNYEEYRETVPEECAYSDEVTGNPNWTVDRGFFMPAVDTIIGYVWGSCTELNPSVGIDRTSGKPGNEVRIYPNPASGDLYISWKEPPDIYTVGLYDLTGKEALSKKVYSGQTLVRLDIRGLRDGLYIMKLHGKNIAESGKLMIRNH